MSVWLLILGHIDDVSTMLRVSLVSKRMRAYAASSRAWCTLIDSSFGPGTSVVMAESALALQRYFARAVAASRAEVDDARAAFYRRARREFIRMTISARIQRTVLQHKAGVHCFGALRSPDGQELLEVPVDCFFAGAACVLDEVVIVVMPYTSVAQLLHGESTDNALAVRTLKLLRALHSRPFCWNGVVPVVTWQMLVDAKQAAGGEGFPALLTVRVFGVGKQSSDTVPHSRTLAN